MDNRMVLIPVPLDELEGLFRRIVREEAKASQNEPEISSGTLLDRQQLAERLNVSTKTISNWVKKGRIPSLKVGAADRFDYKIVRNVLDEVAKKRAKR